MSITEIVKGTNPIFGTGKYEEKRTHLYLLFQDPERLDVLITSYSANPLEVHDEIVYIQFHPKGTPFAFWEEAQLQQHTLPNQEKYFTIVTENEEIVVPYKAKKFPRVIMLSSFQKIIDDCYERFEEEETQEVFINPYEQLKQCVKDAFNGEYVESLPLLPDQRNPEHQNKKEAHEWIVNPQTITTPQTVIHPQTETTPQRVTYKPFSSFVYQNYILPLLSTVRENPSAVLPLLKGFVLDLTYSRSKV